MENNFKKGLKSAFVLEDSVGAVQHTLRRLQAIKTELYDLELEMDNASSEGWNQINSVMIIGDVERKITLINLALETICKDLYSNSLTSTAEVSKICNYLKTGLEEQESILKVAK